jgi:hypothetical protein
MSGELPAYFLREKDLEPDIGLRPLLAAAAADAAPAVRWVVLIEESSACKIRRGRGNARQLAAWRLLIPHIAGALEKVLDDQLELPYTAHCSITGETGASSGS